MYRNHKVANGLRRSRFKPFLKWVGSKRKLTSVILELFSNEYDTYHEIFLGSGAVFFELQPKKAYLSDRYRSKQGNDQLHDGENFCCLGVACDISGLGGWRGEYYFVFNGDRRNDYLPHDVQEYYGILDQDPRIYSLARTLSELNDEGWSFAEIADLIEEQYLD